MPLTRAQRQGGLRESSPNPSAQTKNQNLRRADGATSLTVDPNPRSSKRRRVSSPKDKRTSTLRNARFVGNAKRPVSSHQKKPIKEVPDGHGPRILSPPALLPSEDSRRGQKEATDVVAKDAQSANRVTSPSNTSNRTRIESLPVLENLALQILSLLARLPYAEAQLLVRKSDSSGGAEYATLRSLFEHTKRLYTTQRPFLSPSELGLQESKQIDTLRRANQAIFMSSIFTGEIGLRDMDRSFIDVFVPENGRLLKAQGSIFLELKTQAFVTAMRTAAAAPVDVMADLFPPDMDKVILGKRPGAKSLAPSEQDFLKRLSSRRNILQTSIKEKTLDKLHLKYKWENFSREISSYLAKNFEDSNSTMPSVHINLPGLNTMPAKMDRDQMQSQFSIHAFAASDGSEVKQDVASSWPDTASGGNSSLLDDFVAQAARAAEIAMQGPGDLHQKTPQVSKPPAPIASPVPLPVPIPTVVKQNVPAASQQVQSQFQYYDPASNTSTNKPGGTNHEHIDPDIPHSSQTAPTQVLYERARLAAVAKSSPIPAKKAHSPSQRRPWTTEEENALMTGLDQVKGPHWSQILAMFGPGGTVNESLKDRNQVQLKDKARNLKLFFLKSGIEVPYYLKYVTGDLRTRAPTQASRQEAKERERRQGEEAKAQLDGIQGIMALAANTHQLQSQPRSTVSSSQSSQQQSPLPNNEFSKTGMEFVPEKSDVDAMIARAAAQAAQTLELPSWGV